ncbi:hypothetical protein MLD38_036237 [Melastoma candidum]|uniref:Uncharacterized protein n=1 Tax=Melastoma candidum TaxID=119954 RepID=A0ACB9LJI0_9MYRT|nr:hypothetical protein MLD38_036237 [Melastoma candidum]
MAKVEFEKRITYGRDDDFAGKKGGNLRNVIPGKMVRRANLGNALYLNVVEYPRGKRSMKSVIVPYSHVFGARIPKVLVTLDEKYIRYCINVIHLGAAKAASYDIPFGPGAALMGLLKDGLYTGCDLKSCDVGDDCKGLDFTHVDKSIVGSITKSGIVANLTRSPLFQYFNDLDRNDDEMEASRNSKGNELTFPARLSICSSENLEGDAPIPPPFDIGTGAKHTRFASTSSTFSLNSEQSSSSSSSCCYSSSTIGTISQGMLRCTWNGGVPHFAFSLDDQRELYIAEPMKFENSNVRPSNCLYLFYSKIHGQKELVAHHQGLQLVGKMKVSRTSCLDQSNLRTLDTEFVLYGAGTSHDGEGSTRVLSTAPRKSRGLSKKVVEAFRSGHLSKQRSLYRLTGGSFMSDIHSAELCLCLDVLDPLPNRDELLGDYIPPNLELAAIVTKDHVKEHRQVETGGWGLKFLKYNSLQPEICVPSTTTPSDTFHLDSDSCSSSMKVIIPAGIHGGPRTPAGGPSSLFERWRSGGHCDCGGWDLGCPLRVLKTRSDKEENSPLSKEFDLYLEGTEHNLPLIRMTNIHNDLYLVHFRSNLSALQSFSIAVAHIHRQIPAPTESS